MNRDASRAQVRGTHGGREPNRRWLGFGNRGDGGLAVLLLLLLTRPPRVRLGTQTLAKVGRVRRGATVHVVDVRRGRDEVSVPGRRGSLAHKGIVRVLVDVGGGRETLGHGSVGIEVLV